MKLAEYQDLYYVKKVDFGVYLAEDMGSEAHVLLPSKQVPEDAKPGEKIRVFLYKDSKDRLIATTNTPKLTLGEYAPLVVKEVGKIGAFLDWGLEKDLFLPYKEMTSRVEAGVEYKKAAMCKDVIVPHVTIEDTRVTVALCAPDGQPYAVVVFLKA